MRDDQANFQEWVNTIFNHPVDDIQFYYDQNWSLWHSLPLPEVSFERMIRLFENPLPVLERYTDNQLKWGLYYIVANSPSKDAYIALEASRRERAIQSFYTVFENLFAVKCWPDPLILKTAER